MDTTLASENLKAIEEKPKHKGPLANYRAGKIVMFSDMSECEK